MRVVKVLCTRGTAYFYRHKPELWQQYLEKMPDMTVFGAALKSFVPVLPLHLIYGTDACIRNLSGAKGRGVIDT